MSALISMWGWIYAIGLAVFYLLVLYIIPAGYCDLRRLLRDLRHAAQEQRESDG